MAAHLRDLLGISIHAPYAGRDVLLQRGDKLHGISIHAPRAGRDGCVHGPTWLVSAISIHAPRAGRDHGSGACGDHQRISIHAPHAGRDQQELEAQRDMLHFNPRAPCGARLAGDMDLLFSYRFQSTRPMRGATYWTAEGKYEIT